MGAYRVFDDVSDDRYTLPRIVLVVPEFNRFTGEDEGCEHFIPPETALRLRNQLDRALARQAMVWRHNDGPAERLFRFLGALGRLHVEANGYWLVDGRASLVPPMPTVHEGSDEESGTFSLSGATYVTGDLRAAAMVWVAAERLLNAASPWDSCANSLRRSRIWGRAKANMRRLADEAVGLKP
jgi:hypothetical protein